MWLGSQVFHISVFFPLLFWVHLGIHEEKKLLVELCLLRDVRISKLSAEALLSSETVILARRCLLVSLEKYPVRLPHVCNLRGQ